MISTFVRVDGAPKNLDMNENSIEATVEEEDCGVKKKTNRKAWKDLEGDRLNVLLLFFFYTLQGLPIGLSDSIPLILSNKAHY